MLWLVIALLIHSVTDMLLYVNIHWLKVVFSYLSICPYMNCIWCRKFFMFLLLICQCICASACSVLTFKWNVFNFIDDFVINLILCTIFFSLLLSFSCSLFPSLYAFLSLAFRVTCDFTYSFYSIFDRLFTLYIYLVSSLVYYLWNWCSFLSPCYPLTLVFIDLICFDCT